MWCIRQVKEFESGLKVVSFLHREILEDGEITVDISRTSDEVASRISNPAIVGSREGRTVECRCIEIFQQCFATRNRDRISDKIRPPARAKRIVSISHHVH